MSRDGMMTILELEAALRLCIERRDREMAVRKHKGGEWKEVLAASEAVLQAERNLAAAKGEQYAVPIDVPAWDVGAPMPHLLQNDYRVFLLFYLRGPEPDFKGSVLVPQSASSSEAGVAVLTFEHCLSTKMGTPNDEVLHGHPLHGKGLDSYRAMVVYNSTWLTELETINSVHSGYRPEWWRQFKHYIFSFHDSTFECVARGFQVQTHHKSLAELLVEVCSRLE